MSTWLHDIVFLDPRSRWRVYRVVDRKITSIISGENVDIARLSVLLRSASALKLHSDEAVRTQMASRIWQIERQSPG